MKFPARKKEIIISCFLVSLYFFFRLLFLTKLHIFNDEVIYSRWAQMILDNPSQVMLPVSFGRQPLFIWILSIFNVILKDPLLSGRLVSVFSGFLTLIGLALLSFKLFQNKTISFFTSLIYIFYPFSQMYDRFIMLDSMVGTAMVWALYFSILLVKKIQFRYSYLLGFILGLGLLTKSNAIFNVYFLPFTILLFNFKAKKKRFNFYKWLIFTGVAVLISQIINSIIVYQPGYIWILNVNGIFIYPFHHLIKFSLDFILNNFLTNLVLLTRFFYSYFTIPYLILLLVGILFYKSYLKEKILLFSYFIFPFLVLALFGRLLYPRYIYSMTLSLLPIAALSLFSLMTWVKIKFFKNKYWLFKNSQLFILILFLFYPAFVSLQIAFDLNKAPILKEEKNQYGIKWLTWIDKAILYLDNQAKDKKIYVGTEGVVGWLPDEFTLYLHQNKNITVKGYWPVDKKLPEEVIKYSTMMPTYFIFFRYEGDDIPKSFPLELLNEKKVIYENVKADRNYYLRLFKVLPRTSELEH